ncbi:M-phase inducer phosphatase-like [Patella vulgata]|uniref:M-phase inducer phosphatase-like n=1 Tax=Patella vulgata TaxID=6465 RepID=UPI0024A8B202|nr:M-phase inducer phosphatase-like [Patella vulgata]
MALERMESEPCLIGDASTQHSLPTIDGKHSDLISIESKTVGRLLQGEYSQDYTIIDCRYPYEFDGGHIQGAMNIFTEEGIRSFLENQRASKRGPKLMRLLRSLDRKENSHRYPELYYPEIYLLDGGYKAFYECNKAQCNPQAYLPMLHEDHSSDLRHFRTRSKSWTAGEKRSSM